MITLPDISRGGAVTNSVDNAELARHRWYTIKEGFSASLVTTAYQELEASKNQSIVAIEPFSGSGTTPVECTRIGVKCYAYEVNPFLAFVGRTKIRQADAKQLAKHREVVTQALQTPTISPLEDVSTFTERQGLKKWLFNLPVLRSFTGGWSGVHDCPPYYRAFLRLALLRAVMDNCNAYPEGKCLRYKRLPNYNCFNVESLANDFERYCKIIEVDLTVAPFPDKLSSVECFDSRQLVSQSQRRNFDLCVTSPPYLNSFDYSDVYRPELFLAGYVNDNEELMRIRLQTLRSHVQAAWKLPVKSSFGAVYLKAIQELIERKDALWSSKIPHMVQAYFEDMERLIKALKERANPSALLKIAVGTSAYAGVVIPVDLILADIAELAGWELQDVHVVRRLRSSAQLWKHEDHEKKVPELRESVVVLRAPKS